MNNTISNEGFYYDYFYENNYNVILMSIILLSTYVCNYALKLKKELQLLTHTIEFMHLENEIQSSKIVELTQQIEDKSIQVNTLKEQNKNNSGFVSEISRVENQLNAKIDILQRYIFKLENDLRVAQSNERCYVCLKNYINECCKNDVYSSKLKNIIKSYEIIYKS